MPMRLSGLASGMDTDTIVKQLMEAESMKKTKVENKKTKLEWTQDKWKDLNTKLYSLYTDKVSKMRLAGSYNTKKASVSDSSIASVTAKNNAVSGSYTLEVNRIATSNYVTSGILKSSGGKVTSQTKLSELDGGAALENQEIEISYNGKVKKLTITADTTVADYVSAFKDAGLSAAFDEGQQRMFISSSKSGAESNFSLRVVSSDEIDKRTAIRNKVYANYDALLDDEKQAADSKLDSLLADIKNNPSDSSRYNDAVAELKAMALNNGITDGDIENAINDYKGVPSGSGSLLNAVGMTNITAGVADAAKPSDMAVVEGVDSEIVLNGATLKSSDTTVNVNGLSIDLKGKTNGSQITFAVSNDVDATYDMIKDFLTEYNSLLKEMNTLYKAPSARGYDPLSDEDKEAMSDEQVELWENKIKDSLLRNDTTLNGIISSMKNSMMSTVEIDGKKYSLSSLGIMTSTDYKEGGLLHIYGDTDDVTYADKEDKLRKMLEEDPDKVAEILSGITSKLYDAMNKKMATSSISSAMTFYNDKQIKKQISSYESDITSWEERLQKIEDRYYKQFTAMEKAMAKLNETQNSLASMFNMGS